MMRYLLISTILLLSSCITNKYYIREGNIPPPTNSEMQRRTNEMWGTTRLVPKQIRSIPESARIEARCRNGLLPIEECKRFYRRK